jgi:arsenite methyltransferase
MNQKNIKEIVNQKYSLIARKSADSVDKTSCCEPLSCCSDPDYTVFSESYEKLEGYSPEADLGLGCGIPTEFAGIKTGDHVLDLGSGAGNDCFVARSLTGKTGRVTGLDFSDDMLARANKNVERLGFTNVDFVKGDIEQMPFPDGQFDVIVSNCVLNLVPDKPAAFSEMLRVLKPGGHFCVSDVVVEGEMTERLRVNAEMYAGCVSGALRFDDYLETISGSGFMDIRVYKKRKLEIPEDILHKVLDERELLDYKSGVSGLYSVTVGASKPSFDALKEITS